MRPFRAPKRINMPYAIIKVDSTPNPNAKKLIVEPAPDSIRSFFNADAAKDDPLGASLFEVVGITNVLIHTDFISICKSPESNWKSVLKSVEKALSNTP